MISLWNKIAIRLGLKTQASDTPVWLIDRDGRVYQPTRKVVLRGKATS